MTETRKARARDAAASGGDDPGDMPTLLSVKQAAEWLGVSRRSLYEWMKRGKIPYRMTPSGRRRFLPEDLLSSPVVVSTVRAAAAVEGVVDGRI